MAGSLPRRVQSLSQSAMMRSPLPEGNMMGTFEEYVHAHQKPYRPGTTEFQRRYAYFEQNAALVAKQNADPGRLWTAGLNELADRTTEELAALRGYSPGGRPRQSGIRKPLGLISMTGQVARMPSLPTDFTWRHQLAATDDVQNQGQCGSCWAFAAATVLRGHAELYQEDRTYSTEQILSCTPNERQCGGKGGCTGATAELALAYVVENGTVSRSEWPYTGRAQPQQCAEMQTAHAEAQEPLPANPTSYTKLTENDLSAVMFALYERGPVAVSIAAGHRWNLYFWGIMNACGKNAVIDHAVTLVGYGIGQTGREHGRKYWHLQNSWGPKWGENGFLRLQRQFEDADEGAYCGTDRHPELGSGCLGGPKKVTVCGSCGILYDTSIPDFPLRP